MGVNVTRSGLCLFLFTLLAVESFLLLCRHGPEDDRRPEPPRPIVSESALGMASLSCPLGRSSDLQFRLERSMLGGLTLPAWLEPSAVAAVQECFTDGVSESMLVKLFERPCKYICEGNNFHNKLPYWILYCRLILELVFQCKIVSKGNFVLAEVIKWVESSYPDGSLSIVRYTK